MMQRALPPAIDVYVVEEHTNPSTDYFVLAACEGEGRRVHRCRFDELPLPQALSGAAVVFVRYVPLTWRLLVEATREALAELVYFMDDDLLDTRAAAGMPWRYRYKLYTLATRHSRWLREQRASLWVSTGWLASKYAAWSPRTISPRPLPAAAPSCRVFYHGTASHGAEIRWLRPVMEQVIRADPSISLELIGGKEVVRLYRGMRQAIVVNAMKWPAYQAFMDTPGRHIGLVPLLDVPFNRSRSYTKFFDITRCGAAGIYTRGTECGEMVRHGVDGLVLGLDPAEWVAAILDLARDEPRRSEMVRNARLALDVRHAAADPSESDGTTRD
jgi:hypothetical protein